GLHHHLAASGNFGQVIRKNYPVAIATRMNSAHVETASVVGPLCTPLDLLADQMDLAVADAGDLVAVFQSGAYGATASPQRFLSPEEAVGGPVGCPTRGRKPGRPTSRRQRRSREPKRCTRPAMPASPMTTLRASRRSAGTKPRGARRSSASERTPRRTPRAGS